MIEVKEGEVLGRDGKSIYTPEGAREGARKSAEQVFFRYRKMSTGSKLLAAPIFALAVLFIFTLMALVGVFFILATVKRIVFRR